MLDDILFDKSTNQTVRVRNITRKGINERKVGNIIVDVIYKNRLEGIQITEEILLKNGFYYTYPFMGWRLLCCDFYWDNGSIYIYKNDCNIRICDCKFVHELQHFLKTVGIKKNIII